MVGKIAGLARLLVCLLAIVAGLVTIPNVNVALVLVVLGLIAGLRYAIDESARVFLVALVLPLAGAALSVIPEVGDELNAIANNLALAAAAMAATIIAMRIFDNSRSDVGVWTGKKAS
jgi:hypothetical protein